MSLSEWYWRDGNPRAVPAKPLQNIYFNRPETAVTVAFNWTGAVLWRSMVTTRHGHLRNSQQDPTTVLGSDVMRSVFSHLSFRDVAAAAQVSRPWRALADDDSIWHRLCQV